MKNLFFAIAFTIALSQLVFSQQGGGEPGFLIGTKLGLQTTKFKLTDDFLDAFMYEYETSYKFRPKIGFSGGARLGYVFSDNFSLFTDVSFERSNYEYETLDNFDYETDKGEILTGLVKFEETINRISFPLLARVKLGGDEGGFTISAGPDFSIGLAGKSNAVLYDGVKTVPLAASKEFTLGNSRFDEYVGFNVGFVLGIGAAIPIGDELRLTFDLQRKWGFTDQYSDERKTYVSQTEGFDIQGSKYLRGSYLSVGVEKTFGGTY